LETLDILVLKVTKAIRVNLEFLDLVAILD
jgi:hypothetical protein